MRSMPFTFALLFFFSICSAQYQINAERVNQNLETLKTFGINDEGGNDRVAYSDHELDARAYVIKRLKDLGVEVRIDAAGNISAVRKGRKGLSKVVAFGSHIDAVPNGGHYDGQVGSMAALEVMQTLVEQKIKTNHDFELLIFTNEEGGVFGSRALAGKIDEGTLKVKTSSGYTNAEGVNRLGGDSSIIFSVKRSKEDLHAFIELHIEQGSNLYDQGIDVGVVEGIVGLKWWDVVVRGFANHAGTTPMNKRKDAMLASAEFVLSVNRIAKSIEGNQVATVGRIQAFPGAPNVIPGEVRMSLEIRDLSSDRIKEVYEAIVSSTMDIEEKYQTTFEFSPIDATSPPAMMDNRIRKVISDQAKGLGYTQLSLPSGAGHDAQDMAMIGPTGMIFIPSYEGISHSPLEYSTPEDIANGTQLLLNSLLALDKMTKL